jgi:hypothetical protein
MFNLTTKLLLAASFVLLGGLTAATAQVPGSGLKINAPEPFAIKGKVLPAGDYTISRTPGTAGSSSLLVISGQHETVIFDTVSTTSLDAARETEVEFKNIDGQLFLSKIVFKGETAGKEVVITDNEVRRLAKMTKKNATARLGS